MRYGATVDTPTTNDRRAWQTVLSVECVRHGAEVGEPCWLPLVGVCGSRIGQCFTGKPSVQSMTLLRKGRPSRGEETSDPEALRRHPNRQGIKRPKGPTNT